MLNSRGEKADWEACVSLVPANKCVMQIQKRRREWRLNGVLSSSCLFETCRLELILLPGMKHTWVFVLKHSVYMACSSKHKNLRAIFSASINWQTFLTSAAPKLIYIRWGSSPPFLKDEEQCHDVSLAPCTPAEIVPTGLSNVTGYGSSPSSRWQGQPEGTVPLKVVTQETLIQS